MKPLPHQYVVSLSAHPTGYAQLAAPGLPSLTMAAPVDFDGPGDAWSPEHLLLASVQSCLLLTFRAVARMSQLAFERFEVETVGTVDKQDGVVRFTEIVLRPRLTLPSGANVERAQRILEKSEKSCLVSASLSTPVRMEPTIAVADAGVASMTR